MSRITCNIKDCKYNFDGVCDKSFVELYNGDCQDKEMEDDDEEQA